MRLLSCVSITCASICLALAGCSSAPREDAELDQQVTRALARATDPLLSLAESRERSTATLSAAIAAMNLREQTSVENITNANTIAYKKRVVVQSDTLATSTRIDLEQGKMQSTDRQLDVAIQGEGFFRVKLAEVSATPDGTAYTRCGMLYLNKDHDLCVGSSEGPRLLPPITLPPNAVDVNISEDGTISVTQADTINPTVVGRLELTRFVNAELLTPAANGMFAASPASGEPQSLLPNEDGMGHIQQGFLETSNVDFTKEFLLLSRVGREFELLQKQMTKRD